MKKLGFGFMRLPVIDGKFEQVDTEMLCAMVDHFLEKGFQYFDTAWFYHNGQSEAAVKTCLVDRHPRSSFLLADKMPVILVKEERELEEYFQAQLTRCGTKYFDYYLLHDMGNDRLEGAERLHAFEFLQKKKEAGLVKKSASPSTTRQKFWTAFSPPIRRWILCSSRSITWIGKAQSFSPGNAVRPPNATENLSLSWNR